MDHPSVSPPCSDVASAFEQAVQVVCQSSKGSQRLTEIEHLKVEELVLKRCWLARYWGLADKLGLYPDIAHEQHVVWAGLAPLPNEVVISAGLKAKTLASEQHPPISINSVEPKKNANNDESPSPTLSTSYENSREEEEQITQNGNVGNLMPPYLKDENNSIDTQLLFVEKGLRELVEMKVEEAVLLKISQNQNPTLIWFGLSSEQVQDIRFKQAWLVYYWRRARVFGIVEQDVSMERLVYWMDQTTKPTTYEHIVNVQRGLVELRRLGIERLDGLNRNVCGESLANSHHSSPRDEVLSEHGVKNFHEEMSKHDKGSKLT